MLNYLRSELYKTLKRKYTYIFTGVLVFFSFVLIMLIYGPGPELYADTMFMLLISMLPFLVVMGIAVIDIVFSDEYKNNTIRNSVSFGISRSAVYTGKLLAGLISAIVIAAVIYAAYILFSLAVLGVGEDTWSTLYKLGERTLAALPLWIAGLALSTCIFFIFKNGVIVGIVTASILFVFPQFLKVLEVTVSPVFRVVYDWQIVALLDVTASEAMPAGTMLKCYAAGAIHTGLFTLIGMLAFNRREIQ